MLPDGTQLRVSVVIPAKNEARNLPFVLPLVSELADEVILVDGHSSDATISVARTLLPSIHVVDQSGKGKGDALRCGFAHATGDIVVMIDADGSNDPHEIRRFIAALLAGADFAKGSRFLRHTPDRSGSDDITVFRFWGNKLLTGLVNVLFRAHYTDLCYGYNAFWRRCLDSLQLDCDGFEVETVITLRVRKAQLHVTEIPSYEHARKHGVSNLNAFRDGWYVLKTIFSERFTPAITPRTTAEPVLVTTIGATAIGAPTLPQHEEAL